MMGNVHDMYLKSIKFYSQYTQVPIECTEALLNYIDQSVMRMCASASTCNQETPNYPIAPGIRHQSLG